MAPWFRFQPSSAVDRQEATDFGRCRLARTPVLTSEVPQYVYLPRVISLPERVGQDSRRSFRWMIHFISSDRKRSIEYDAQPQSECAVEVDILSSRLHF